ncbi:uncharacterized protein BDZ83DRAFT_159739 [Colletotrichum acutatum]|uniref:Uncharacterized protein n=1 Tax=Glomerella acutata TaxID=27357 RepID=A0AAD9D3E9_GLOAC|nr:uncharacterized protein BDZ83DRAFT_159739 [Colletotrichum acutatum]KAK1731441.1 hypothetical protein BDZ83DRAFT_159739 [Colletotrichum acutatum]
MDTAMGLEWCVPGTGSTLDLGTKNGVFRCRPTTPVWTGAHRMAPIATVPDGTRYVACSEITPGVWYWLLLSPFLRRMGTVMPVVAWGETRSPDVSIGQDRGGIAVGKGKETMSRKAKRYFGTGYQVRIKVAVSLNRVSRWMETWQARAILMTIFSIRLRAASCAGPRVMTSRFWTAARGIVAVSVAADRRATTGMGRSAWRTETVVMHGGPRACVGLGGCVAIRSPISPIGPDPTVPLTHTAVRELGVASWVRLVTPNGVQDARVDVLQYSTGSSEACQKAGPASRKAHSS